jgi:hypothetical protein
VQRTWDRWAPVSGAVFVALIVVTFFLPTESPPGIGDSAQTVVSWFADHRTALLASGYLSGLAIAAFLVFLSSLVHAIRETGESMLATIALAGGLVLAAYALAATATHTLLAHNLAATLDPSVVKALWEIGFVGLGYAFPLAVVVAATSLWALRTRYLPQWYGALGFVASVWFVVGGATYARDGFFAPDGAFGFIAFVAFLAWVLLTSILILQHEPTEEKGRMAAPTPA